MPDLDGFAVLAELKADPGLRDIPVIIYTARVLGQDERERLSEAVTLISKEGLSREQIQERLYVALAQAGIPLGDGAAMEETRHA